MLLVIIMVASSIDITVFAAEQNNNNIYIQSDIQGIDEDSNSVYDFEDYDISSNDDSSSITNEEGGYTQQGIGIAPMSTPIMPTSTSVVTTSVPIAPTSTPITIPDIGPTRTVSGWYGGRFHYVIQDANVNGATTTARLQRFLFNGQVTGNGFDFVIGSSNFPANSPYNSYPFNNVTTSANGGVFPGPGTQQDVVRNELRNQLSNIPITIHLNTALVSGALAWNLNRIFSDIHIVVNSNSNALGTGNGMQVTELVYVSGRGTGNNQLLSNAANAAVFTVTGSNATLVMGPNVTIGAANTNATRTQRGVQIQNGGTFQMQGGTINTAIRGVDVQNGTFNMLAGTISNGTETGVDVQNGTFNMHGGTINNNGNRGVNILNGSTVNLVTGTISGSQTGVDVQNGTFNMHGGTIQNNVNTIAAATARAGGVHVAGQNSFFNMSGGRIGSPTPTWSGFTSLATADTNASAHSGGGVAVINGATFSMSGGTIAGNRVTNNANNNGGGGVLVRGAGSTFTMTSGIIESNHVNTGSNVGGGGVRVDNGATFTMHDGIIRNHRAGRNGGNFDGVGGGHAGAGMGVLVAGANTNFHMHGGTIYNNVNNAGGDNTEHQGGGGVAVINNAIFNMTDGSIERNARPGHVPRWNGAIGTDAGNGTGGGGLFIHNATANLSGNARIARNISARGGGISLEGGTLNISGNVVIEHNVASHPSGDGSFGRSNTGGIFVGSGSTVTMNGGTIRENAAIDAFSHGTGSGIAGGGVRINAGGTFILNDGSITGNVVMNHDGNNHTGANAIMNALNSTQPIVIPAGNNAWNNGPRVGGAIAVLGSGTAANTVATFIMNGGSITNNVAGRGGGIALNSNATVRINGGIISNNEARGTNGFGGGIGIIPDNNMTVPNTNQTGGTENTIRTNFLNVLRDRVFIGSDVILRDNTATATRAGTLVNDQLFWDVGDRGALIGNHLGSYIRVPGQPPVPANGGIWPQILTESGTANQILHPFNNHDIMTIPVTVANGNFPNIHVENHTLGNTGFTTVSRFTTRTPQGQQVTVNPPVPGASYGRYQGTDSIVNGGHNHGNGVRSFLLSGNNRGGAGALTGLVDINPELRFTRANAGNWIDIHWERLPQRVEIDRTHFLANTHVGINPGTTTYLIEPLRTANIEAQAYDMPVGGTEVAAVYRWSIRDEATGNPVTVGGVSVSSSPNRVLTSNEVLTILANAAAGSTFRVRVEVDGIPSINLSNVVDVSNANPNSAVSLGSFVVHNGRLLTPISSAAWVRDIPSMFNWREPTPAEIQNNTLISPTIHYDYVIVQIVAPARPPVSMTISPTTRNMEIESNHTFTIAMADRFGQAVTRPAADITWTIVDASGNPITIAGVTVANGVVTVDRYVPVGTVFGVRASVSGTVPNPIDPPSGTVAYDVSATATVTVIDAPPTPHSIELVNSVTEIEVIPHGTSNVFTARVLDRLGRVIPNAGVTWSIPAGGAAGVTINAGTVTIPANANLIGGTFTVRAAVQGNNAITPAEVAVRIIDIPRTPHNFTLTPTTANIRISANQVFTLVATDRLGRNYTGPITWTIESLANGLQSIANHGITYSGGTVTIPGNPALIGGTFTLRARANNSLAANTSATATNGTTNPTYVRTETYNATVTSAITIEDLPWVPHTVEIINPATVPGSNPVQNQPVISQIPVAGTGDFDAIVFEILGRPMNTTLNPRPALTWTIEGINWSSTAPIVPGGQRAITISNTGVVTVNRYVPVGTTFWVRVAVTSNPAIYDRVQVTVIEPDRSPRTVTITPSTLSTEVYTTHSFTVTAFDQFGLPVAPVPGSDWAWTVSSATYGTLASTTGTAGTATVGTHTNAPVNTNVLTIPNNLTLTGNFNVTATVSGTDATGANTTHTATATVTIIPPNRNAHTVVLTPVNATREIGTSIEYTATVTDRFGHPITAPHTFTWNVTRPTGVNLAFNTATTTAITAAGASTNTIVIPAEANRIGGYTVSVSVVPVTGQTGRPVLNAQGVQTAPTGGIVSDSTGLTVIDALSFPHSIVVRRQGQTPALSFPVTLPTTALDHSMNIYTNETFVATIVDRLGREYTGTSPITWSIQGTTPNGVTLSTTTGNSTVITLPNDQTLAGPPQPRIVLVASTPATAPANSAPGNITTGNITNQVNITPTIPNPIATTVAITGAGTTVTQPATPPNPAITALTVDPMTQTTLNATIFDQINRNMNANPGLNLNLPIRWEIVGTPNLNFTDRTPVQAGHTRPTWDTGNAAAVSIDSDTGVLTVNRHVGANSTIVVRAFVPAGGTQASHAPYIPARIDSVLLTITVREADRTISAVRVSPMPTYPATSVPMDIMSSREFTAIVYDQFGSSMNNVPGLIIDWSTTAPTGIGFVTPVPNPITNANITTRTATGLTTNLVIPNQPANNAFNNGNPFNVTATASIAASPGITASPATGPNAISGSSVVTINPADPSPYSITVTGHLFVAPHANAGQPNPMEVAIDRNLTTDVRDRFNRPLPLQNQPATNPTINWTIQNITPTGTYGITVNSNGTVNIPNNAQNRATLAVTGGTIVVRATVAGTVTQALPYGLFTEVTLVVNATPSDVLHSIAIASAATPPSNIMEIDSTALFNVTMTDRLGRPYTGSTQPTVTVSNITGANNPQASRTATINNQTNVVTVTVNEHVPPSSTFRVNAEVPQANVTNAFVTITIDPTPLPATRIHLTGPAGLTLTPQVIPTIQPLDSITRFTAVVHNRLDASLPHAVVPNTQVRWDIFETYQQHDIRQSSRPASDTSDGRVGIVSIDPITGILTTNRHVGVGSTIAVRGIAYTTGPNPQRIMRPYPNQNEYVQTIILVPVVAPTVRPNELTVTIGSLPTQNRIEQTRSHQFTVTAVDRFGDSHPVTWSITNGTSGQGVTVTNTATVAPVTNPGFVTVPATTPLGTFNVVATATIPANTATGQTDITASNSVVITIPAPTLVTEHVAIRSAVTNVTGRVPVTTDFAITLPLSPRTLNTEVLSSVTLTAGALDQFGDLRIPASANSVIRWRITGTNNTGATISGTGPTATLTVPNNATAGTVTVEAYITLGTGVTATTVTDTITITVIPAVREAITIAILPVTGETTVRHEVDINSPNNESPNTFRAEARDRFGDAVANAAITWTINNNITPNGNITGVGINSSTGTVTVIDDEDLEGNRFNVVATLDNAPQGLDAAQIAARTASTPVTIAVMNRLTIAITSPANLTSLHLGHSVTLNAEIRDRFNTLVTGAGAPTVVWSISSPSTVPTGITIDPSSGLLNFNSTDISLINTTIRVRATVSNDPANFVERDILITDPPRRATTITVDTGGSTNLPFGEMRLVSGTVLDQFGIPLPGNHNIIFSSSNNEGLIVFSGLMFAADNLVGQTFDLIATVTVGTGANATTVTATVPITITAAINIISAPILPIAPEETIPAPAPILPELPTNPDLEVVAPELPEPGLPTSPEPEVVSPVLPDLGSGNEDTLEDEELDDEDDEVIEEIIEIEDLEELEQEIEQAIERIATKLSVSTNFISLEAGSSSFISVSVLDQFGEVLIDNHEFDWFSSDSSLSVFAGMVTAMTDVDEPITVIVTVQLRGTSLQELIHVTITPELLDLLNGLEDDLNELDSENEIYEELEIEIIITPDFEDGNMETPEV
ncbi:MAG: hypothetical protein FWF57_07115 [Defluviitaleaceae bacterium]|nr:hypothetical protein [Defluviitaleaceae bacterium]